MQCLRPQVESLDAPVQGKGEKNGKSISQRVLAKQRAIGDIHHQAEPPGRGHANTQWLMHWPSRAAAAGQNPGAAAGQVPCHGRMSSMSAANSVMAINWPLGGRVRVGASVMLLGLLGMFFLLVAGLLAVIR